MTARMRRSATPPMPRGPVKTPLHKGGRDDRDPEWQRHGVMSPAPSPPARGLDGPEDVHQRRAHAKSGSVSSLSSVTTTIASDEPLSLDDFHRALPSTPDTPPRRQRTLTSDSTATLHEPVDAGAFDAVADAPLTAAAGSVAPPLPHPPRTVALPPDPSGARLCAYCGARKTPLWRAGPKGFRTLCNRCGIIWKRGRILQDLPPAAYAAAATAGTHRRAQSRDAGGLGSAAVRRPSGRPPKPTAFPQPTAPAALSPQTSSDGEEAPRKRAPARQVDPLAPHYQSFMANVRPLASYTPSAMTFTHYLSDDDEMSSDNASTDYDRSGAAEFFDAPVTAAAAPVAPRGAPARAPRDAAAEHYLSGQRAAYLSKKLAQLPRSQLLPVVEILRATPLWRSTNLEAALARGEDAEIALHDISDDVWRRVVQVVGGEPRAPGDGAYLYPRLSQDYAPLLGPGPALSQDAVLAPFADNVRAGLDSATDPCDYTGSQRGSLGGLSQPASSQPPQQSYDECKSSYEVDALQEYLDHHAAAALL